ncbi:MAG: twin-arginine translocation signal domain-containing protein [Nitriliruptorales bacterium]|nr:twin-arginine translocation signal domain-containing protein [Nitriliruptorales bacterium]
MESSQSMEFSRRDFLKLSATAGAVAGWATFGFDLAPAYAQAQGLKIDRATEVRSVCPYCAVGCSMIAYVTGHGETTSFNTQPTLVHIEGDPDSPINGGSLCPKGASTMQLAVNQDRVAAPKHRAPGATEWQDISWEDALDRLARLMKDARDERFVETEDDGDTVNRNEGFAWVGGATISNEEGYLTTKLFRALGCVGVEQQARV